MKQKIVFLERMSLVFTLLQMPWRILWVLEIDAWQHGYNKWRRDWFTFWVSPTGDAKFTDKSPRDRFQRKIQTVIYHKKLVYLESSISVIDPRAIHCCRANFRIAVESQIRGY